MIFVVLCYYSKVDLVLAWFVFYNLNKYALYIERL